GARRAERAPLPRHRQSAIRRALPSREAGRAGVRGVEGGARERLDHTAEATLPRSPAARPPAVRARGLMATFQFRLNGTPRALLNQNPKPTEAQVRGALAGNLCRCGSHARVLRAIMRVAAKP